MNEEIDLLKYILTNIRIQRDMLQKILRKKKIKDEVYELIRHEIFEYKKFIISLNRMLETRQKKYNKEANVLLGVASSINANINKMERNEDYLKMLEENAKVNILDINRVKKEYNIKSKTVQKLITRLVEFEKNNLLEIDSIINIQ